MICGIDPGAKGAIALLFEEYRTEGERDGVEVYDMPTIGKEVNGSEVAAIFTEFRPEHIYLEQVNAFGMGRTSAFTFGQCVGVLKGVFQSLKIPYTMVTPQKWQKHYGKSSDKEHSRQLANRLFPSLADRLNRKKDDGRAEALLIAKYGSEQK